MAYTLQEAIDEAKYIESKEDLFDIIRKLDAVGENYDPKTMKTVFFAILGDRR